ncbi:MAG: hypothetical protein AB7P69_21375, partial [Candidatus Binatia bacterium]
MMIQNLIQAIATLLQSNLTGISTQHTLTNVLSADQLSVLARYLTELQVNQSFRDCPTDPSPRSLPATQRVAFRQKRGLSLLAHTPIPGTPLVQPTANSVDAAQSSAADAKVTLDTQALLALLPISVTLAAMHEARGSLRALRWLGRDAIKRKHIVETLHRVCDELERRLEECTAELRTANEQLRQQSMELERAEVAIAERLRFETLLSEFSTRFLNLPSHTVDRHIEQGLQRLAEFVEAEQGVLLKFSKDKTQLCTTHMWTVLECEPALAPIPFDQLPWATEQLRCGEIVLFSYVSDLPDEATRDKEYLGKWGPKSAVVIPLAVAGSITGAISLASLRTERPWP